jgi:hypothetical protein
MRCHAGNRAKRLTLPTTRKRPAAAHVAGRLETLGFAIFWYGVSGGHVYDPNTPPSESFKVEDPDGIVVDVTIRSDQWPGTGG